MCNKNRPFHTSLPEYGSYKTFYCSKTCILNILTFDVIDTDIVTLIFEMNKQIKVKSTNKNTK